MKIISVCSGKGGVGKTSIAVNLAAALQSLNKRTLLIDCNLTTSHLGLMFGFYSSGRALNNFLRNESKLEETIHSHASGLSLIPAALELNELANLETQDLKQAIKNSMSAYDFVILDSAPGIGREALVSLRACDEALYVANPYIPSVVDILKTRSLSSTLGFYNLGIIINRVTGKDYELKSEDIYKFTELPVIGMIPEDEAVLKSLNAREISFFSYPEAASSKAFYEIAHKVAGLPFYRK